MKHNSNQAELLEIFFNVNYDFVISPLKHIKLYLDDQFNLE